MNKVFDVLNEEFIDADQMEVIAPPERYQQVEEDDFHLKTIAVYSHGVFAGMGLIDEVKQQLFSGYVSCEKAKERGITWESWEDE